MLDIVRHRILELGIMNVAKRAKVSHSRVGDFAHNRRALTSVNLEKILFAIGFEIRPGGLVQANELRNADPTKVADISRLTALAIEIYRPLKVILFGSQARGDWQPGSDIDLMIVGPSTNADEGEIYLRAFRQGLEARFETVVVSHETFQKMQTASHSIFSRAEREGVKLYER